MVMEANVASDGVTQRGHCGSERTYRHAFSRRKAKTIARFTYQPAGVPAGEMEYAAWVEGHCKAAHVLSSFVQVADTSVIGLLAERDSDFSKYFTDVVTLVRDTGLGDAAATVSVSSAGTDQGDEVSRTL